MIVGRFGRTSGSPYVEGWLLVPRQRIDARLSFLVDTGADSTTLMPMDAKTIGLDHSRLTAMDEATGLGGRTTTFIEDAIISFLDEHRRRLHSYRIRMDIVPPNPELDGIPSLLGRDILNRWRMVSDFDSDILTFTARSADLSTPI